MLLVLEDSKGFDRHIFSVNDRKISLDRKMSLNRKISLDRKMSLDRKISVVSNSTASIIWH